MYQPPGDQRPGCRDTWVLTRAAFSVLLPILGVMIGVLTLVMVTIYLLLTNAPLALIPAGLLVAGVVLYARWERGRGEQPPPEF